MTKLKLFLFVLFLIFSIIKPSSVFADISSVASTTLSEPINCPNQSASYEKYQYLGRGLSGNLSKIDIKIFTPAPTYYGKALGMEVYESDEYIGGIINIIQSKLVWKQSDNMKISINSFDGIVTFNNPNFGLDYNFNPNKYYYLVPVFFTFDGGGICQTSYFYGSDDSNSYPTGEFYSDSILKSIYFKLYGLDLVPVPEEQSGTSVMFFPGIMGSELFEISGTVDCSSGIPVDDCIKEDKLWPSSNDSLQSDLSLDLLGKSNKGVYSKEDAIVKEISLFNIYKSFILDLNDWKTEGVIKDYALVPYDWRLSLEDIITNGATTTDAKLNYLNTQNFSESYILKKLTELSEKSDKIILVGHSNGGLVIKALMQKLKDTNNPLYYKIDKIIFVAVPQVGTPEAIVDLLHGESLGPVGWIMSNERLRQLSENFPVTYNLLPSGSYFSTVNSGYASSAVVTFDSNSIYSDQTSQYGFFVTNLAELKNYILGLDGRVKPEYSDTDSPNIGNATLYNKAINIHQVLDSWQPASTTKVIQIAGWGEETTAGIDYRACKNGSIFYKCLGIRKVIDGDGTVVVPSALWMSTSTPNVERWWVDLKTANTVLTLKRIHRDILEVDNLRSFIKSLLINQIFHDPKNIVVNNTSTLQSGDSRLHFILHSPLTLGFLDTQGRYTGKDLNDNQIKEEVPDVKYEVFGETQFISIPEGLEGKIVLKGYKEGIFALDIENQHGNDIIEKTSFQAVPSSTTTSAFVEVNSNFKIASSTLKIDENSDGIDEIEIHTKLNDVVVFPKYIWNGYLQPINDTKFYPEQKLSVFKAGSTIPVKFQLKDLSGKIVQTNSLPIWLLPQKLNSMNENIGESTYSESGTSGTSFKWDSNSQQYIYNWSTKGLQSGYWYRITTKLDDGNVYSVVVGLK